MKWEENLIIYISPKIPPILDASNPETFKEAKIGCVEDNRMTDFYYDWARRNGISAQVVSFAGFTKRDEAFLNHEIDAITATDRNIAGVENYVAVTKLGEEPVYLAVAKSRTDILNDLNAVLSTLNYLSPNYLDALQIKAYGDTLSTSTFTKDELKWIKDHDELRVGYVEDYMPFSGTDSEGNVEGLVVDVAEEIARLISIEGEKKITYVKYDSFKSMSEGIVNNEIDFSFPVISERRTLSKMDITGTLDIITVPFYVAYEGVYSDDTFSTIALNTRPIKAITDNYPSSEILTVDSAEACLDAILDGDATCTVMSSYRLKVIINDPKYKNLKTMPFSANLSYCIGVDRGSNDLLGILNKCISFIDSSMLVDAVYRYIQEDLRYTFWDFLEDNFIAVSLISMIVVLIVVLSLGLYARQVVKSKKLLSDNLEKMNILAALSRNYEVVHMADLDEGTFTNLLASEERSNDLPGSGAIDYETAVKRLVNLRVFEDAREDFLKFLDIDAMKARMEEERSFSYRYAIVSDGTGRYIYEMTFVRVSNDPDRHLLVAGTKCIDDILKIEREEGQYNAALLSESEYFYEFDVTDGRIDGNFTSRTGANPIFDMDIEFPISYDEFNRKRSEALDLEAITPKEGTYWTTDALKDAFDRGKKAVEIRYASKKLQGYWNATIILSEDEVSHHLHAVYICKDVTEQINAEQAQKEELKNALLAAETANKAKTVFLNNMSHDIRTPMNAILGFADLLAKEKDNPDKVTDYINKIKYSGSYLLEIINDVLDMARIESGKAEVDEDFMDLLDEDNKFFAAFEDQMKAKNITMSTQMNITHRYVLLDRMKVQQIVMNLISNAVKYTPEGGTIDMTFDECPFDTPGFAKYVMKIKDSGIGMSEEFCQHIFDSFTRERNTTESKISGTGLGMSIVKKLVDLLGGTIEVESELGVGSTFTVSFAHKIVDEPKKYLEAQLDEEENLDSDIFAGMRILLAEDNELNAEIAMTILEDKGLIVEHAIDGVACVDMLTKQPAGYYSLILMDIQMPNLNGYMATERIRALGDNEKAQIPIIAMTANAFEEDRKKAIDAGMNGHLSKPINVKELMHVIKKYAE